MQDNVLSRSRGNQRESSHSSKSNFPIPTHQIKYLCWNSGGPTSGALKTQEFTRDHWHVISSGSTSEKGAGVAVLVRETICQAQSIRYTEVIPGRALHIRIPGEQFSLDVICAYQLVWRSQSTAIANKNQRQKLLDQLHQHMKGLPSRNTLLLAGDFNSSLIPDKAQVAGVHSESMA